MMKAYRLLVDATDVAAHAGDEAWRVFDCRHDLARPEAGELAYRQGHIPGAQFLHLDRDLSGPMTGRNGRHPLPDPQQLATRLAECGVDNDSQVVAYDDAGGAFAVRLWWLLRWLGHERVAVLDGGLQAWTAAGQRLTSAVPAATPTRFAYRLTGGTVDPAYLGEHLDDGAVLVVDARSGDRFRGRNETLDPVAGRIPGSVNRFFKDNLGADGRFKPAAELRNAFSLLIGDRPPRAVVHSCGSGVTACHNQLAMELAGLDGSRLYPGSWSEWCSDPARPVATGD